MNHNIEFRAVNNADDLRELREPWNALVRRSAQQSVMLSYAWISRHFEHFRTPGTQWACILAMEGSSIRALLPVTIARRKFPLPHRVLQSAYGHHLNISDILCDVECDTDTVHGLLQHAFESTSGAAVIELLRVSEASPSRALIPIASTLQFVETVVSQGYYLPVPEQFEEYEASLSRNFRSNMRKATNKLSKLEDVTSS